MESHPLHPPSHTPFYIVWETVIARLGAGSGSGALTSTSDSQM